MSQLKENLKFGKRRNIQKKNHNSPKHVMYQQTEDMRDTEMADNIYKD